MRAEKGGLYAIFLGPYMPYILEKSLCHMDPHCMACLGGHIFCECGGWGWSELFSHSRIERIGKAILAREVLPTAALGGTT